jgi:membrane associated rhomboid family serine protease
VGGSVGGRIAPCPLDLNAGSPDHDTGLVRPPEGPIPPLYNPTVASGAPDLFVVCKHCGSEVSPYITECPYCGHRLQKRAPKISRDGKIAEKPRRRTPTPSLPRLRRGEIPGIRHDQHPYATAVLVLLGFIGPLLLRTNLVPIDDLVAYAPLKHHIWRVITSPFVYGNTGYTVLTLAAVGIFGFLMERRHGPPVVVALFLVGAVVGTALGVDLSNNVVDGANGGALALIVAWAIPDLFELAAQREVDGDLLGAGVFAAVIALMPLAAPEASWVADAVGVATGLVIGYPIARLHRA